MIVTSPAIAQVCQTVPANVMGQGTLTCGSYLSADAKERSAIDIWVLGFVSGANVFSPKFGQVGGRTDNQGVLSAVRKFCDSGPDRAVYEATFAYIKSRTVACK